MPLFVNINTIKQKKKTIICREKKSANKIKHVNYGYTSVIIMCG